MKIWLLASSLFFVGCASIGPRQIKVDRSLYNDAITATDEEQLLRNIVRLRHLEPPSFLKINSITSSHTLGSSMTGGFALGISPEGKAPSASLTPGINFSDSPTISYAPVNNSDFIKEILAPIQLDKLALLLYGGMHDPNLIFKLAISSIAGIDNAIDASDLKIISEPEFGEFYHVVDLLHHLAEKKGARIVPVSLDKISTIAIRIFPKFRDSPEAKELKQILAIPDEYQDIVLIDRPEIKLPNSAFVETRSIMGILIRLSHSVEVPEDEIKSKRALRYHVNHKIYDWEPMMDGLIKIRCSKSQPDDAFIRVKLHGFWYYINLSDFDSLATFGFLNALTVLSAGNSLNGSGEQPIMTIPVR